MEQNRPSIIPGYIHPENPPKNIYTKDRIYKTFSEGQEPRKVEVFNSTNVSKKYVKNNNIKEDDKDFCPVCSNKYIEICNCVYNDKKCIEGHIWYTTRDNSCKIGNPHKK